LEEFKALVFNNDLLALIKHRLKPQDYIIAHNNIKKNIESIIKLLKDRLLFINAYDENWEGRINEFKDKVNIMKERCTFN